LTLIFGSRYRTCYRALADYFRRQGPLEIAAGGLLAGGGEELFFRGVLLEGLMSRAGLAPAGAIGLSAALFGTLHLIPDRRLAPFALWAAGQGVILGTLYVATGSVLVPMVVHAIHDSIGFGLLAWQRRSEGRRHGDLPAGETPG
jgi:membrane protease YdiL (CAAX protease family)